MHKLEELKEKLIDEMEDYAGNGKFSKEDVELIKYMSSAVDHICNIIDRCDGDYSGENRMMPNYTMRNSYARRRDRMGRYSSDGYSRAENNFRDELQALIDDAPNDQIRQKMQRIMSDM